MKVYPNSTNRSGDNTFDKIRKGPTFNSVEVNDSFKNANSSESDGSKENKFNHVSFKPRPLIRKKQKRIPELRSSYFKNAALSKTTVSDKIPTTENATTKSTGSTTVFDSLSVEMVNQKLHFSSLTFLKFSRSQNEITSSSEPFFSEAFLEKQAIHSSTPCMVTAEQKIVGDPISPITRADEYSTSKAKCDNSTAPSLTKSLSDFKGFTEHSIAESSCKLLGIVGLLENISIAEVPKNDNVDEAESSLVAKVNLLKSASTETPNEQNREELNKSLNDCIVLDNIHSTQDSNEVDCITINSTISNREDFSGEIEETEERNISIPIPTVDLSETVLIITPTARHVLKDLTNAPRRIFNDVDIDEDRKSAVQVEDSEIQVLAVESPPTVKQQKSDLSDIIESSIIEDDDFVEALPEPKSKPFNGNTIKPGKLYRRSLSQLKRTTVLLPNIYPSDSKFSRPSVQIVPLPENRNSILKMFARTSYLPECSVIDLEETLKTYFPLQNILKVPTARDIVLQKCCQEEYLLFSACYSSEVLKDAKKIGEGVYSEVFLLQPGNIVLKVIPIEGSQIINGERQKEFKEILSEIVIATELTNLRRSGRNSTKSFSEVEKVRCVKGCYPDKLLELWNDYHETKCSENDSPAVFEQDQLYIVFEFANAGEDLETFIFNNAIQTYSMFRQTACALAVAEAQLKFEHRDLHWGNVLVKTAERNKKIGFSLCEENIEIAAKGIEVTIIDFTMSRIENDSVVIFIDLSTDEDLFTAAGDYQFDVYRMMRNKNGDEWQHYEPYTNILWLHYLLDKAIGAVNYKNAKSKIHKVHLKKLKLFKKDILSFSSVSEFVKTKFVCK